MRSIKPCSSSPRSSTPELFANGGETSGLALHERLDVLTFVFDLSLDLVNHEVHRGTRRLDLSARELMLLKVLMREPGRVFTRDKLEQALAYITRRSGVWPASAGEIFDAWRRQNK